MTDDERKRLAEIRAIDNRTCGFTIEAVQFILALLAAETERADAAETLGLVDRKPSPAFPAPEGYEFTGEHRTYLRDEWFLDHDDAEGRAMRACRDGQGGESHYILRRVAKPAPATMGTVESLLEVARQWKLTPEEIKEIDGSEPEGEVLIGRGFKQPVPKGKTRGEEIAERWNYDNGQEVLMAKDVDDAIAVAVRAEREACRAIAWDVANSESGEAFRAGAWYVEERIVERGK